MSDFDPFDPVNMAMRSLHSHNLLAAKDAEIARLKAEVERLKAVSTIEQRTIQGLQQTPEWSEIARLTAYCRELEDKVKHLDLFKSVVEKFFNSASLKNPLDTQSYYALAENLKQLPDSILDFTEEQVRDNPAWALAVFRHKVKEMQYKRIHDLNEIGGAQEENAHLHSQFANSEQDNARLKAEVERLRASSFVTAVPVEQYERLIKAGDLMSDHLAHEFGICPSIEIWNAAKEGKPSV